MDTVRSIHWARLCCALFATFLLTGVASMRAQENNHRQNDSLITRVLFVGTLNFDCYRDTVVGWADDDHRMLPRAIHWGAAPAHADSAADSACASPTPARARVRVTEIRYPEWNRVTATASFMRMNDDTLADIVLILRGKPNDTWRAHRNLDGVMRSDSLRMLLIPGQQALDSIRTLNLASIGSFQSEPYFALELSEGTDVVDPAVRDASGAKSYEVKPVQLDVHKKKEKDSTHQQGPGPQNNPGSPNNPGPQTAGAYATGADGPVLVRLFPNPASTDASVSARPLSPGSYTIEIIATNGQTAATQQIDVTTSRDLLSTFDVSRLASGYYLVRLSSRDHIIGSYPIIVTR
jgi:hypothetical protein